MNFLLMVPLVLSAFTHMWNPIQFPSIHSDEGTYMLHALTFMKDKTLLPQGAPFYDHPYFGQIFLAGVMGLIGYPSSLNPIAEDNVLSIELLYLVPRVLMGLLAVGDTFLVYKIAERRYNRTVAFIAAAFFAVMPISWILRRILLDNLLLPFLLSSILFATYIKDANKEKSKNKKGIDKKYLTMIILSGVFLGLAIFTKIPAFTFVPLVAFFVLMNTDRSWKLLGLWFVPVIIIPAIWPMAAYSVGQFDNWFDAIIRQATEREDKPLIDSIRTFFQIDPILLVIGTGGIVFACLKRDLFILLAVIPYVIFLQLVEFVSIYHLVVLLPPICIASSVLIYRLSIKIKNKKLRVLPFTIISAIFIIGLLMSYLLINTTFNSSYFKAYAVLVEQLPDTANEADNGGSDDARPIVVGRFWTKSFLWATQYVFDKEFTLVREDSRRLEEVLGEKGNNSTLSPSIILVIDNNINRNMRSNTLEEKYDILRTLHDLTYTVQIIEDKGFPHDRSQYPYSGLYDNRGIGNIEIRSD